MIFQWGSIHEPVFFRKPTTLSFSRGGGSGSEAPLLYPHVFQLSRSPIDVAVVLGFSALLSMINYNLEKP